MPLLDLYEVKAWNRYQGQEAINVTHWEVSAIEGTEQGQAAIADYFDARLAPAYKACMHAAALYEGITVQRIRPTPPTLLSVATGRSGPGLVAGEPLPKQVSSLVNFFTSFAGRRYRGRNYIPFPGEGSNGTDTKPVAGHLANLANIADALFALATVGVAGQLTTLRRVIFSRRPPETRTVVIGRNVIPVWATQRRRGDFGRTNDPLI